MVKMALYKRIFCFNAARTRIPTFDFDIIPMRRQNAFYDVKLDRLCRLRAGVFFFHLGSWALQLLYTTD